MHTEDTDKRYDSSLIFAIGLNPYHFLSFFYRCASVVISFLLLELRWNFGNDT